MEWINVSVGYPAEYQSVFVVDPESGVTVGYYNGMYWKDSEGNRIWGKVVYWQHIDYPEPPEGSVDTDWD